MALSDMVVRQAKAIGKDYTLGDLDGLSLGGDARGNKSWHFRYSWLRRQKRMSPGPYPQISLREARTLRDQAAHSSPRASIPSGSGRRIGSSPSSPGGTRSPGGLFQMREDPGDDRRLLDAGDDRKLD